MSTLDPAHPRRREPWLLRSTLLVGMLLVAVGTIVVLNHVLHGPLPFDRERWDAEVNDTDDETRHRMADGLINSNALLGKRRADIVALLGEPPATNYFREFDLVYWLGLERGWIRLDSEWLVMRLDANGRVTEAGIVTD
ncbi:MAG: hypothetical protein R3C46_16600 [Hyphomonadaceae bacterium]